MKRSSPPTGTDDGSAHLLLGFTQRRAPEVGVGVAAATRKGDLGAWWRIVGDRQSKTCGPSCVS